MLAVLLGTALATAPGAEPPAPLPDRFLLKLAPADLPKLPDTFWKTTWLDASGGRNPRAGWTEWIEFAPGAQQKEAGVTFTKQTGLPEDGKVTVRSAPLAVHGALVEFDRKLYTVALTERKGDEGKTRKYLTLGAAVEIKPNVWYQAFSEEFSDGTGRVTELSAEFAVDPRKEKEGKATVRQYVRALDERQGKLTEFEGEFTPAKGKFGPAVRVWGKLLPGGAKHVWFELPYETLPPRFDTAPFKQLNAATDATPKPKAKP